MPFRGNCCDMSYKCVSVLSVFARYNDQPHGEFCVLSENQKIEVNTADMTRQIRLNFTRYQGAFGSVILTFNVQYDIVSTIKFNYYQSLLKALYIIQENWLLKI